MKRLTPVALLVFALINTSNSFAQESGPLPPAPVVTRPPAQTAVAPPFENVPDTGETNTVAGDKKVAPPVTLHLTPSVIQTKINEAQRLLKTKPMQTAALTTPSIEFVTIAALDRNTNKTHLVTISKKTFLTKGAELTMTSSYGVPLTIRIIRANGVNTAMTIFTPEGKALVPLTIEYPIERKGAFLELAYYTSAHPALLSRDLTRSGQAYVRNMLELAARKLRDKGITVSPMIMDVAERLCLVEHVDHERFRNENRLALYEEIYSLFSLNEFETYKYSVSTAGAGGMVQMIPWAYNLQRQRYPGVGLIPDFVVGMRTHSNALQAMLLYMKDTWTDLTANEDIQFALTTRLATPSELLAAGYNSNSAKLPGYIKRGGDNWRTLIPRETQMYLQIYKSFESLVPMRARATPADKVSSR